MIKIWYIAILFLSCKTNSLQKSEIPVFDYQGHRGCRGLMPENTIQAMLTAIELGVITLETDVVITKDKQAILSHEPIFNHEISTKPNGEVVKEEEEQGLNIYKMTYAEVQRYDVGLKPHPRFSNQKKVAATKPLLTAMIDSVESYCKQKNKPLPFYNIETKSEAKTDGSYHPLPDEFVEIIMKVIQSKGIVKRTTIQSFDPRTLRYLHKKYQGVSTALLIEDFDKRDIATQINDLGFVPSIYSPHHALVTAELIQYCHDKKIRIIPWTVNDLPAMQRLKAMGVDGIISDYPNLYKTIDNRR